MSTPFRMPMCSTLGDSDLVFGLVLPWQVWISGRNKNVLLMGLDHEPYIHPDLFQKIIIVNFIHDTNICDHINQ